MSEALTATRAALAGQTAWLVGGAVRDRLLGRDTDDLDVVVEGDPRVAARALAGAVGGAAFELSGEFGAWRVVAGQGKWQVDVLALAGAGIEEDLARRDFTVNAIAEPLAGGEAIDPFGGADDARRGRLRMVSPDAFADDPLRTLRLARFACELSLAPEPETLAAARAHAAGLAGVAAERVFSELRRIVVAPAVLEGLALMSQLGLTAAVLPELDAMRGVEQNRFHHLDVYDHTLAVLEQVVALERDLAPLGEHAAAAAAVLAEPLADDLTRGEALRFGALLHDAAKPRTQNFTADGHITFFHHDAEGAQLAEGVLGRLRASQRLRAHVAALTRHHLRLGFLVHERPLSRRAVHRYLCTCAPVEVDVTVLSVADRLATRGRNASAAIEAHLELARQLLGEALRWRADGPPAPLLRGDELTSELGIAGGPDVGRLLAELEAAQFAGEIDDRASALRHAREFVAD